MILLDAALEGAEARTTMAHEVAHVDLGHDAGERGWFGARAERAADRLAARRLVDVEHLADALVLYPLQPGMVARHLEIPLMTLRRALEQLTPDQVAVIEVRVAGREGAA